MLISGLHRHMHTCLHTCTQSNPLAHIHLHTHIHTCIPHMHTFTPTCMYTHIPHMHSCAHIHPHIHVHTYTTCAYASPHRYTHTWHAPTAASVSVPMPCFISTKGHVPQEVAEVGSSHLWHTQQGLTQRSLSIACWVTTDLFSCCHHSENHQHPLQSFLP